MYKPMSAWLLAAAVSGIGGCTHCQEDEEIDQMFDLAEILYRSRRYDDALGRYENVLKRCPEHYQAWIGMGHASREYGNDLFKAAHHLAIEGKREKARKMFDNAVAKHQDAFSCFNFTAREMRPEDLQWRMGLGLFWYQRATSMVAFPYPLNDTNNRQRDRDKAILEFQAIVRKVPNSYQAHHKLSMLLLAAGRYDEALGHLRKYHNAVQTLYDYISQTWPNEDVKHKTRRDEALEELQGDLTDVRELVVIYKEELKRQRLKLIALEAGLTAKQRLKEGEELKRRAATLTRQTLAIENFISSFVITILSPEEKALRERCVAYLREFNNGKLIPALQFLDPPAERRDELREHLMKQVSRKIRFLRPRFKAFDISGGLGRVTFECEMVTPSGSRPATRLTIGWRQVSGHWMVSDLP